MRNLKFAYRVAQVYARGTFSRSEKRRRVLFATRLSIVYAASRREK